MSTEGGEITSTETAAGSDSAASSSVAQLTASTSALTVDPKDLAIRQAIEAKIGMTIEERYNLIHSVGEECVNEEELRNLLAKKEMPTCYDGFEPSGRMHIAQGIMKALNVNKLTKGGCKFVFWIADWFAFMNNKMGGDMKKIQTLGKYMIEIWRAVGMDLTNVEFVWASDHINAHANDYWTLVLDIARNNSVSRIKRCSTIMGRAESDELSAAQIMYPCMQCADVFYLKADICQLGLDQRKVNMLAREYCDQMKPKRKNKPIILSHHMMMGLLEGQAKMSKSDPDSAIFMEDSAADVTRKVKKAYCPPGVIELNPCIEYIKYILLPWFGKFPISRSVENGGNVDYTEYSVLEADYIAGKIHPGDLKAAISSELNKILEPVRQHFEQNEEAKALLKLVRSYKVTK